MAPPKPIVPAAAQPYFGAHFDAWNSSSSGHQRAENRLGGSIGWRQSRAMKLSHQYKSRGTGGKRMSDQIGAGSEDWDEKAKAMIPKSVRARAKVSVEDMLLGKASFKDVAAEQSSKSHRNQEDALKEEEERDQRRKIFDGLVIYINGSTYPLIGDHKLKHLLAENGAKLSLHLGRKHVTHVILGRPSDGHGAGAGGGLAGTKIEKEIKRVCGHGVKYVGVEWVLESLKAGKRLGEAPFACLKAAAKDQQSVYQLFQKTDSRSSENLQNDLTEL